ncbi:hypothetical protein M407DRAFT_82992 [Tulasnella calospora MUT 4182]|uniref:Uncharacterized protein n=1 Tax=Tulasnella calospora MUT 4182 TaxID=1051891 RepID=A0A0C3KCS5_9AGAM|nr:hypothetical protein M407DRAFT_82992 [Tulasnella calospora MUT 4182]
MPGVHTNARVEAENRVNKLLGDPKITMCQLFDKLNSRTEDQYQNNQIAVQDYTGPFALHTAWHEMEESLNYSAELSKLPDNGKLHSYHLYGQHSSDSAYVSLPWLLHQLITLHLAGSLKHLVKVVFSGSTTKSEHSVIILDDYRYLCDCCMGSNLGVPC